MIRVVAEAVALFLVPFVLFAIYLLMRRRNPAWGLRWLHDVQAQAEAQDLALDRSFAMPANNLLLAFVRRSSATTTGAA